MCIVKTPKLDPKANKPLEPTVIRNPYLDGLDPVSKALRTGRSSLRIERAGRGTTPVVPPASATPTVPSAPSTTPSGLPRITPVRGGGGVGGGGRIVRSVQNR